MKKLFISNTYNSAIGPISAVSSEKGIRHIVIGSKLPSLNTGDPFDALTQIQDYFEGRLKKFSIPIEIDVSAFTKRVLDEVAKIPFSNTLTYGEVAKAIESPAASRAIGGALHRNPVPIIIPCHRILAKSDIGGYAFGLDSKRILLDLENIHCK